MVVLTLHRDTPLSPDEIHSLPIGCYPVMSDRDVVARAELNLPMAHVARFAAAMARAIPDADFSAEHRPTTSGVAVLEAGALESPFWAYEPALPFRRPMPSAHHIATTTGVPQRPPPPSTEEEEEDAGAAEDDGTAEQPADTDEAPLSPAWSAGPGLDRGAMAVGMTAGMDAVPPPPMLTGVEMAHDVPPEVMAMLQRMQQLNGGAQGAADGDGDGTGGERAWPEPPPRRPDLGSPARGPSESSFNRIFGDGGGGGGPRSGPAAMAAAVDEAWALLDAGEEAAAEGAFLLRGSQPDDLERLVVMFSDASGERVAQACRVARWLDWPGGVGLLQRAAAHPAPEARLAAVQALALHGGPAVEPMLHLLSRDLDPKVSSLGQRALKRVTGRGRL